MLVFLYRYRGKKLKKNKLLISDLEASVKKLSEVGKSLADQLIKKERYLQNVEKKLIELAVDYNDVGVVSDLLNELLNPNSSEDESMSDESSPDVPGAN